MSVAVGRLVAHEARHQYVGSQHFDDGGLGGESVEILGVKRSERFLEDDQKQIAAQISTFERIQRDARIHIETFPRGQPFAFHEG